MKKLGVLVAVLVAALVYSASAAVAQTPLVLHSASGADVAHAPAGRLTSPGVTPDLDALFSQGGELYARTMPTAAAVNLTAGFMALCGAGEGAEYTFSNLGGYSYVMTLDGDSVAIGGKTTVMECPVDTTGLSAEQMQVVADWPLLRAANPGVGHFTQDHLRVVLSAMEKPAGIIAEQTLRRIAGADWKYFQAGGLNPGLNRLRGWLVSTDQLDYVVWRSVCNGCDQRNLIHIHHFHRSGVHTHKAPAPKTAPARAQSTETDRAPAPRHCPSQITIKITGGSLDCTGACAAVQAAEAAARAATRNCQ